MNATLRDRLILLEQRFLIAVVDQDGRALEEFSLELSQLTHHFKAVEASGNLDEDTTLLLSRVSQVIRATTQCVLECEDVLKAGLISCSNLPLPSDDLLPVSTSCPAFTPYRLLFSHVSSSGTLGILGHNKLLDACAYRWLMQNMLNPYPTPTQLRIIGDESMASVAEADLWFQEARDLIGWTRLSDEFFTGSISATITAAKRVYLEHDNTIPFSIAFAFSKVKAYMETLFAEHSALPTLTSHDGCSAQAQRPVPVVNDSTDFNDPLDDEDTTPPPPVAGCKRNLPEDTDTSLASDLHRPVKRFRAQSVDRVHPHSASTYPLSNTSSSFKEGATEAVSVTSVQLSNPSFPVGPQPSPDPLAFGQCQTNPYAPKTVVSHDPSVPQGKMRNQQISDTSPLSERQLSFVPNFVWPIPIPSLLYLPPADSAGASQITVSPGAPVDLSVFDWNSIPNPLVESSTSTNQPASVYVPSSDLTALNFGLPDPLYPEQSAERRYNPSFSDTNDFPF
ncbi:hypothetical protein EDB85DRAFT_1885022 [Lactarius pseudohatsudake]|nr:hypothetical protein EDB85DRAFT_1885022 [Lactarius pseudohatsudake]